MLTSLMVMAGLVLTLVLEIYPSGLSPEIALFLALAGAGGVMGLLQRSARRELLVLAPWFAALLLAMLVGAFRNGESMQAMEDSLPYLLFMLGLFAGRGASKSRAILVVLLWVCVLDSFVSLYKMPSYGPGMRSTYTYWKITAGLPLVGMFASSMLRNTDPKGRSPRLVARPLHAVVYVVMLVAMVLSVSRGMMLGWVLGVAVAAYVRRPSQTLMLGVVGVVLLVGYSSVFSELGSRYLRVGQSATIEGRFREIEAAWLAFTDHPLFGDGLGAMFEVDGFYKAFVHNMAAYHLWKFGLIGCALLSLPLWAIGRQIRHSPRNLQAIALGGGIGVIAYLVTCAGYKVYYLVWIYGVTIGATLSWLAQWRQLTTPPPEDDDLDAAPALSSTDAHA